MKEDREGNLKGMAKEEQKRLGASFEFSKEVEKERNEVAGARHDKLPSNSPKMGSSAVLIKDREKTNCDVAVREVVAKATSPAAGLSSAKDKGTVRMKLKRPVKAGIRTSLSVVKEDRAEKSDTMQESENIKKDRNARCRVSPILTFSPNKEARKDSCKNEKVGGNGKRTVAAVRNTAGSDLVGGGKGAEKRVGEVSNCGDSLGHARLCGLSKVRQGVEGYC